MNEILGFGDISDKNNSIKQQEPTHNDRRLSYSMRKHIAANAKIDSFENLSKSVLPQLHIALSLEGKSLNESSCDEILIKNQETFVNS